MIKYNYFGNEQKVYYEKMNNGMDVYVIPNNKINGYHAEFIVRYGSTIDKFKPIGENKYVTIPLGTAHFLEHKVFEMENENVFSFFGKTGTYANAGTTYTNTRYYIDGKKNFASNLDYLTTMIFTPFFTDDTIEKEISIIGEEIKMYLDTLDWKLELTLRKCLTDTLQKNFVAGSEESIKKINAKLLNKIYETFYQPSNIILLVSGNVSLKKILDILKNNDALNNKKTNYPILYKKYKECKHVVNEYYELRENIKIPKLKCAYKFDLNDFHIQDKMLLKMYLNLIYMCLFGDGSDFEEDVIENKIATFFYHEHHLWDNIYVLAISCESEYADVFLDKINETFKNASIDKADFERAKKICYSLSARSIDDHMLTVDSVASDLLDNNCVIDSYELINKITYEDFIKIVKKLDFSNKTVVLMLPKDR